jgi:hypothetical protein
MATKFYPGWAEREPIAQERPKMRGLRKAPKHEPPPDENAGARELHATRPDVQPLFNRDDLEDNGTFWSRPLDEQEPE